MTWCKYMVVATYTFPGRELTQPVEQVTLEFFTWPRRDQSDGEILAFVDGDKVSLGSPERVPNPKWRLLRVSVPATLITRIANGGDVTIKGGGIEHHLTDGHLKRLRELAGSLIP